ncbi:hypothetical protein C8D92_106154 [Tamilnaduibacter salinus]|uniref:Uncharacterized protein n=1 Tax=Tamilnaduibacter salinus TaxID=1484056 RepID=A0A2A2I681_9GAMM|nr:hypothetical protein [Tamilnaduibacter salinus]PAV26543.1 hypothetical protein CF392_04870 [Tamilnaduibacter salinus]PVY75893.1 hypothetical protein C8D92_106154 [Tamilnaduibacter salinus]
MKFLRLVAAIVVGNLITIAIMTALWAWVMSELVGAMDSVFESSDSPYHHDDSTHTAPPIDWEPDLSTISKPSGPTAEEREKAQQHRRNLRSARQMCQFWREQYRDEPTKRNDAYKTNACLRLKNLRSR